MRQARLGQLVSQFILAAVANQLATRGGRKVALVLERDLTAAVEPEGFCAACRQCFDTEGVFRLPVPADQVRQAVDRGAPTEATCPAGLAFLAEPLAIGPAHVVGYLAIGHVADVKALEERLFALAQEADDKPAGLARRYWNTTKPNQVDWSVYANQLRQAAIPLVTVAAATWQEYAEVPSRPPDELDDLHLLSRDAPDTLRTALRRACLANDADAGAALLPPEPVSSLPKVVAFNLSPAVAARIAPFRAELERELAHQAATGVASLAGHPALAGARFAEEGFRSAVLSRANALGGNGPVLIFLFRKPRRGRPEELALAQEWARSMALLYLTVSARERESALAATVHALGEISEAADSDDLSACGQVLARWAARCTGGTAAVLVPDERHEPKLLAHSTGLGHAGPLLSACRWLARQALARRVTMRASSDLLGKEEENEEQAGLVVAHPLGTPSRVLAVLAVAWPREEGDRALGDHREVLATVARIGGALLNALAQRQEMAEAHAHAVQLLVTALEARFPWLSGHAGRTARLARATALALGLGLPEAEEVYEAALLHDVGHLRADAGFLDNPDQLAARERKALSAHVLQGAELLAQNPLLRRLAPIVRHHRERWDGSGYPDGLRGQEIPLGARILAAAEAFDAMLSERPHRAVLGLREALAEMAAGSGRQFDPECVQALLAALKAPEVRETYSSLFQESASAPHG